MSMDGALTTTRIISCGSAPCSAPSSPRNRVKFLCSHGGRILPRPADGHLKYVGGETRVISVPRDIHFQELMKKLTCLIDGEMILKYQVVCEDLDVLVSVKSDEDLRHMFDEIDRYESMGSPRLRAFLFPVDPIVMENSIEPHAIEQRYIDSINGIIRSPPFFTKHHPIISTVQHGSLVSSACSSPKSPDSCTTEALNSESMLQTNYQNSRTSVRKVPSSPSICSLSTPLQSSHYAYQLHPQYWQNYRQAHQPVSHKPPTDSHKSGATERLMSVGSVGRADGIRCHVDLAPGLQYYHHASRQNQGSGCCRKCMHYDDCYHLSDSRFIDKRGGSFATRSVPTSPRYGQGWHKAWD